MRRSLRCLLAAAWLFAVAGAFGAATAAESPTRILPGMVDPGLGEAVIPGLWVRQVADGVWVFTAEDDPAGEAPVAANGMVFRTGTFLVMVDTGWNAAQAQALVEWFDRMESAPVRAAVVTHAHPDRTGGLAWLREHGVRVEMLDSTAARLGLLGDDGVETFHGVDTLRMAGRRMELWHPGAGYSRDNIVVWMPDAQILYAGSLVRPAEAKSLGWIEEADLARWPTSLKGLQRRYPSALFVIPGEGRPGGTSLIDHTIGLLRARRKR